MPKKIVVFADGTGNAFSTQESNVWRLYAAVDQKRSDQIAHYIKGVGTSGFKPFALVDGATGIGVPSNVRKLYRFISWNWKAGDEIYMFGFSRGAFTIRTLVGLIHSEGLVPIEIGNEPVSHAGMRRNSMAAWRSYRSKTTSWKDTLFTITVTRFIRDILLGLLHLLGRLVFGHPFYRSVRAETVKQARKEVPIKFVGLFDTVEAFGVPIEEFRRAIDWAIWPVSFRNRVLSKRVESARHALSLDDERATFHPVRFDMEKSEHPERIKEVWFAGVHSDVGGGYPEDGLAHVPLIWMMNEIAGGLRFLPGAQQALAEAASAYAPVHDSRSGLAAFYRYSPREVGYNDGPPVVHHSVAEKIALGVERYAPVTLPDTARVLMPDGSMRTIKGFDMKSIAQEAPAGHPADQVALQAVNSLSDPSPVIVSLTLDAIWKRRVAYYCLLFAAFAVASLPWTVRPLVEQFRDRVHDLAHAMGQTVGQHWDSLWAWLAGADQGSSAFIGAVFQYVGTLLPGYAKPWADALIDRPSASGIVIIIALYLYVKNASLRDSISDLARQAWMPLERTGRLKGLARAPEGTATLVHRIRTSRLAKLISLLTSRYVLPGAGLVLIFAAIGISISRSTVTYREGSGALCSAYASPPALTPEPGKSVSRDGFSIDQLCWPSGFQLQKGRHYELTLEMTEPFFDQTLMTDIAGFKDTSSLRHLTAQFVRRWWTADWFQPIAKVGRTGSDAWPLTSADGYSALPIGTDRSGNVIPKHFYDDPSYKDRLAELHRGPAEDDPSRLPVRSKIPAREIAAATEIEAKYSLEKTFISRFTSPADGELMLYVNDAIAAFPFARTADGFYANNSGRAKVTLKLLSAASQAGLSP
jgi:Uncharacterized alpha/beta hydrolase domain (DUF2235)